MRGAVSGVMASKGIVPALAVCALVARGTATAQQGTNPAADRIADSLLPRMTVEEKLGQLAQYTGQWVQDHPEVTPEQSAQRRPSAQGFA